MTSSIPNITAAGIDYTETTMDLTFTSVDTSFQISVEISPDELFENLEFFFGNLQIAPDVERVELIPDVATVNIVDNGKYVLIPLITRYKQLFIFCVFPITISITLPTDGHCPALPDFTNGVISYSMGGPNEFPNSTIATYSCNEGYFLEGEPDRTCRVPAGILDGTYDGEEPYCVRKSQVVRD